MTLTATVLDAPNARELADFYRRLLGWTPLDDGEHWVTLRSPAGARLSFQTEPHFVPPVWPGEPGSQLIQAHLDIAVTDLDAATDYAVAAGARLAEFQPQEHVRVCLDPAGHPFCLYLPEE
ncbi:VOC family protein [Actinophytocola gossypii]|uniref:VOC family protein n=1 Tax=Actinophytocola gossypii TaxID=2812003 RepID=A0ABT2J945_9PSEU|nr:VOC family protein [Actinophytocola gossypii]MCT2584385.1 VOC family protein [Actinophytocola gossypii]